MFFETKKTNGPVRGLLAVKVARAKQRIAAVPSKPKKQAKPKRD